MNDKELLSDTILSDLDIFNNKGILKVGRLNNLLRELIKSKKEIPMVEEILKTLKIHNDALTVRLDGMIHQFGSKLKNVKQFVDEIEENPTYEMSNFQIAAGKIKKVRFYFNFHTCKPGLYEVKGHKEKEPFTRFGEDFKKIDQDLKRKLISAGFDAKMKKFRPERFRIVEQAEIHTFSRDLTTVSFEENGQCYVDENFRGRTLVKFNASLLGEKKELEAAIFLPLQSAVNNYYHNLSETVFGMRVLEKFPPDIPIIYRMPKHLKLVPFYAEKLGIDPKRLISIEALEGVRVKRAVLIHKDGFFWTKAHYEFFNQFVQTEIKPFRKIYLSRKNSRRAFKNEDELEEQLKTIGFEIVYAEALTLEEQIKLFSETELLISGHGAGLANIVFMKPKTKLIELFHESLLKSDFYVRSVHNQMAYQLLIADKKGNVDIDALFKKIKLIEA